MIKQHIFITILSISNFAYLNAFATCDEEGYFDCGITGENKWYVSNDQKTLTIIGNGAMADYEYGPNDNFDVDNIKSVPERTTAPWGQYGNQIENLNIDTGVTSIGKASFVGMDHVTSVNLPDTLHTIGQGAFDQLSSLTRLKIPDSVTSVGYAAFAWTTSLTSLDIGNGFTAQNEKNIFQYIGRVVPQHPGYSDFNTNPTIYCNSDFTEVCTELSNTYDLNNVVLYSQQGDRLIVDGQKYKSLTDFENHIPVKRIYTIDEANRAAGKVNTFTIRYR